eukprot:9159720-Alexandrium_andersonii.AAC.1
MRWHKHRVGRATAALVSSQGTGGVGRAGLATLSIGACATQSRAQAYLVVGRHRSVLSPYPRRAR